MTQPKVLEKKYLIPWVLITCLFAAWGFANDITNPLVAAFGKIMEIPQSQAALVQLAFYGGYGTMAIPAAIFISKFSYKSGVLLGLFLYFIGAVLFYPAAQYEKFIFFLLSLYILTFGLAFLETTANPYILAMGDPRTAVRRLNLSQAFNPIGSLSGQFVAASFILSNLQVDKVTSEGGYPALEEAAKSAVKAHDLHVIQTPYVIAGICVFILMVIIALVKMPQTKVEQGQQLGFVDAWKILLKKPRYREGVIAQVFYVAVQIMMWTFIIQYAERLGYTLAEGQYLNILAMGFFLSARFIATYLMKFLDGELLLLIFAVGGMCTTAGTILIDGPWGLYCLIFTSFFMSLMFPTIYGLALYGCKAEATHGAAGLVMAIVGGALCPPLQGALIDHGDVAGIAAVNFSFILPFICFVVIAIYGFRCWKVLPKENLEL